MVQPRLALKFTKLVFQIIHYYVITVSSDLCGISFIYKVQRVLIVVHDTKTPVLM